MTTDELVRQALRDLTDTIHAEPGAAARARKSLWRSRRRRIGVGLAGVLAIGAGWVVAPSAGDEPSPDVTPRQIWSQRLYEAAPRGGVATADPAFVQALAGEAQRAVGSQMPPLHLRAPRVLYADDLGTHRVAVVAFEQAQVHPTNSADNGSYATMNYIAARGADAVTLVHGFTSGRLGLAPLFSTVFVTAAETGPVVALAPPGCTIATAADPQVDDWQPVATGSYLAHEQAGVRPEWWQVTCDGVVRQETLSPRPNWSRVDLSDEAVARRSKDARGTVNNDAAKDAFSNLVAGGTDELVGESRALWGGAVTWPDGNDSTMRPSSGVIAVQQLTRAAGWVGTLAVRYDQPDSVGSEGELAGFERTSDPTAANAVVPIELGSESHRVLVLVPSAAVTVRVVSGGRTLTESSVDNGVAEVEVGSPATVDYQALDSTGRTIGSGRIEDLAAPPQTETWDDPLSSRSGAATQPGPART